jgi:hypothetical protein
MYRIGRFLLWKIDRKPGIYVWVFGELFHRMESASNGRGSVVAEKKWQRRSLRVVGIRWNVCKAKKTFVLC